jgi:hypothetical protein
MIILVRPGDHGCRKSPFQVRLLIPQCKSDGVDSHDHAVSSPSTTRTNTPTQQHEQHTPEESPLGTPQPTNHGKQVQFNLNPAVSEISADESYASTHHADGSRKRRRRRDDHDRRAHNSRSRSRSHSPRRDDDKREVDSEDDPSDASTVELPPRFDEHGRPIPERGEDPLVESLQELFGGNFLKEGIGALLGSSSGGGSSASKRRSR